MIRIVMKPLKAPVVARERLYGCLVNGRELFRMRARNAARAEEKLLFMFERETTGKVFSFDIEEVRNSLNGRRLPGLTPGVGPTCPDAEASVQGQREA